LNFELNNNAKMLGGIEHTLLDDFFLNKKLSLKTLCSKIKLSVFYGDFILGIKQDSKVLNEPERHLF